MRNAQASTPAPTSSVTTATTRRRWNAASVSVWSRGTGSTSAARTKARSSATGFIGWLGSRPARPATAGPLGVGARDASGVDGARLRAGVGGIARDGIGHGPVEGEWAAGRRPDQGVEVVLATDHLVQQAADERLGDTGGHRRHEPDPLAGEVGGEHRHGDDAP